MAVKRKWIDSLRSLACKLERIRRTLEEEQLEEARRGERYNIKGFFFFQIKEN